MQGLFQIKKLKADEKNLLKGFLEEIFSNYSNELIAKNITAAKNCYGLIDDKSTFFGGCFCQELKFGEFHIGGIGGVGIDPEYRGKGIGAELLDFVISDLNHLDGFMIWTRIPEYFSKVGFKDYSYGIETKKEDSLPMLKCVNQRLNSFIPEKKWPRVKF